MDKPDLDSIDGLSPAVSIDQKTTSKNPRSTVGTVTEIYDYLRLLFARVGTPHCPECGRVIERQTTDQVADKVLAPAQGAPRARARARGASAARASTPSSSRTCEREGFTRVRVDGEVLRARRADHARQEVQAHDRGRGRPHRRARELAGPHRARRVEHGHARSRQGKVWFWLLPDRDDPEHMPGELLQYSLALACPEHGHSMDDLQPRDFSFNAPYGACPDCDGLGFRKIVDAEALIEDPSLSVGQAVSSAASSATRNYWPQILAARCASTSGVSDPDAPGRSCPRRPQEILLDGLGDKKIRVDYRTRDGRDTHWFTTFPGVRNMLFDKLPARRTTETHARRSSSSSSARCPCSTCHGARLKPEILAVTVGGKSIYDVC